MPRTLSISDIRRIYDAHSEEVLVLLVRLTTADGETIHLSSDPTEVITKDPIRYGTRSRGDVYYFAAMGATIPDDLRSAPMSVPLTFENISSDIVETVRASIDQASCELDVVYASAPDSVLAAYVGLKTTKASYNALQVSIEISRENEMNEYWPAWHFGPHAFPGLF